MNRFFFAIVFPLTAFILVACGSAKKIELSPFSVEEISLSAFPGLNKDRPVAVDIVFPFDEETLRDLEGFTADGWFTVKDTDLGDWKEHAVWLTLEVAPGEQHTITNFPEGHEKALAVVIYANYGTPGLHRFIITKTKEIKIQLGERDFGANAGSPYLLTDPPEPLPRRQM